MEQTIEVVAAGISGVALIHTFATRLLERLSHRFPRHLTLFPLFGEVEVVFGFWAIVLVLAMTAIAGGSRALDYVESRQYAEPLFVFSVMVVAASKPILQAVKSAVESLARLAPIRTPLAMSWLGLAAIPLLGSLITEPAAMTIAAVMLAPRIFKPGIPGSLRQCINRGHPDLVRCAAGVDGHIGVAVGLGLYAGNLRL